MTRVSLKFSRDCSSNVARCVNVQLYLPTPSLQGYHIVLKGDILKWRGIPSKIIVMYDENEDQMS